MDCSGWVVGDREAVDPAVTGAATGRRNPDTLMKRCSRRSSTCWSAVAPGINLAPPADAGTTRRRRRRDRWRRSNPRGRGDDPHPGVRLPSGGEQPPRSRGRHAGLLGNGLHDRATPAVAGTTAAASGTPRPSPSNPRGRGDDLIPLFQARQAPEQPPRSRGRPLLLPDVQPVPRATPAVAGTTSSSARAATRCASNPRGRGDDGAGRAPAARCVEQPPRSRGRHGSAFETEFSTGATPAVAGTTT